jgi:hypothetical protein
LNLGVKISKPRVVIWGYPLYSHTHSYIHDGFYNAFRSLSFDVYWFSDDSFPINFNFENCIFITEGFADKNIPLRKSSIYFVAYCPDPNKYLLAEVKDFIELRPNCLNLKDHIYNFEFDKFNTVKLGPSTYFQETRGLFTHITNEYVNYLTLDYKKIYMSWATHLLPSQIKLEPILNQNSSTVYFDGTLSKHGVNENYSVWKPFIKACKKLGISFIHNNSWENPLSNQEIEVRAKKSKVGIDLRGPAHISQGYIPCRVFKMIGFGHLGLTNSEEVYKELEGHVLFKQDPAELLYEGLKMTNRADLIIEGIKYVKEHHTYVNRVKAMLSIL